MNSDFKRTILVAEDNEINREILVSILADNYNVIAAKDGKEALDLLNKHASSISLILLDLQMPIMNGYEVLEAIDKDEKLKIIPVIVETSEKNEEERALLCGASDFISKPYSPTIIISRIKALIRLSESVNALQETKFDTSTGLYNRNYFGYIFKKTLESLSEKEFDLILFRIKEVDQITGIYGEEGFSKQINFIGSVLTGLNKSNFYYCRASATMFVVLKPHDEDTLECVNIIKNALHENPPVKNVKYDFVYDINIDHETSFSVFVNRFLAALKTKEDSYEENIILFDVNMLEAETKKKFITSKMEDALKNNYFKVFYQPKHDTQTHELKGFEALVRWFDPITGLIPPFEFIPIFEENGFIYKLDTYIIKQVVSDMVKIREKGLKIYPVSINLSRRDLPFLDIERDLVKPLEDNNINKSLLHIEITESMCGSNKEVINVAEQIRKSGFFVEIDDFGSGYSALGIIETIPMDYLKLDISFARNIRQKQLVVKTIIELAHALGAKTIAEGVEDKEQLKIYNELGCDLIQGYYFSKPICFDEYVEYVKKNGN